MDGKWTDWTMIRALMLALLAGTATHCTTGLDVSLGQPVALSASANLSRTTRPHCFFVFRFSTSNIPPVGTSLNWSQVDPSPSLFKEDDDDIRRALKDCRLVESVQCNHVPTLCPYHLVRTCSRPRHVQCLSDDMWWPCTRQAQGWPCQLLTITHAIFRPINENRENRDSRCQVDRVSVQARVGVRHASRPSSTVARSSHARARNAFPHVVKHAE